LSVLFLYIRGRRLLRLLYRVQTCRPPMHGSIRSDPKVRLYRTDRHIFSPMFRFPATSRAGRELWIWDSTAPRQEQNTTSPRLSEPIKLFRTGASGRPGPVPGGGGSGSVRPNRASLNPSNLPCICNLHAEKFIILIL
jgi:hypothetical protein